MRGRKLVYIGERHGRQRGASIQESDHSVSAKDPQKTGTHNSSQLWHSRVVKSSNLTFGGYLAGTTLVLSVRSSLFIVHVLF